MKSVGLIFDESFHYIDHLAPFCSSMRWPLVVCEPSIAEACRSFYPDLDLIHMDFGDLKQRWPSCLATCDNRALIEQAFGWLDPPPFSTIWVPHGLSDKGWKRPLFEALTREDLLLVYGQRMRDVLQTKGVSLPHFSIGNFRKQFYQTHRRFYQSLVQEQLGNRRFILYAPTWEDGEDNGTFWDAFPLLIKQIPPPFHLLIKVHPNTQRAHMAKLERCKAIASPYPNVSFVEGFPPIYPLLEQTDLYIGDMSSIGYDFLSFHRPFLFLRKSLADFTTDPSSFLMQCGQQLLIQDIPTLSFSLPQSSCSKKTEALYSYAFDLVPDWTFRLQKKVDTCLLFAR